MRTLFIGQITPPIDGQAVAFTYSYNSFDKAKLLVDMAKVENRILNTILAFFHLSFVLLFKRYNTIYFMYSRTLKGVIKEIPIFFLKRRGVKIIGHLQGVGFNKFYETSGIMKPLLKRCYNKVAESIVPMTEMTDEFKDFKNMKVNVVPNFYSSDFDISENYKKNENQITFLSNCIYSKGITFLLDAAKEILTTHPKVKIKIAGRFERDSLKTKNQIKRIFYRKYNSLKEDFGDSIEYLGVVKGNEKVKLSYESSIFILPSFYSMEVFPIAIMEAMRSGNVIITTNHNHIPCLMRENNGVLIEPRSSKEIEKAVNEILSDKKKMKTIQANNMDEALKKYSQEQYRKRIRDILLK